MSTKMKTLGDRIRSAREAKSLTQANVANHLGITRSAIAQWELGTTAPDLGRLGELAKFLSTTPEWLAFEIAQDSVQRVPTLPEGLKLTIIPILSFSKADVSEKVGQTALDQPMTQAIDAKPENLIAVTVSSSNQYPQWHKGDRAIADGSIKVVRGSDIYLWWDGYDAAVGMVSIIPGAEEPTCKIESGGSAYTMPMDKARLLGKVVAKVAKV